VILNSIPQHGVSKKLSEKARGKKKMEYVPVNTDDDDVPTENETPGGEEGKSGDDEETETLPPPKFGPPRGTVKSKGQTATDGPAEKVEKSKSKPGLVGDKVSI
jgi:hypothetical protein